MLNMAPLYADIRTAMDKECKYTASILLIMAGENDRFLRAGVDLSLSAMVHSWSPGCVMKVLLIGGHE